MADLTKAEQAELLEQQEARIRELEERLETQDSQIKRLAAKGEGWLVTAHNPLYDGVTFGLKFVNGMAFIRRDQTIEQFETKPMKDNALAAEAAGQHPIREGMTDEMRQRVIETREAYINSVRERENKSSAERCAQALSRPPWQYKVEYYSSDRLAEIQDIIDQRAVRAAEMREMEKAREQAQNLVRPGYMGE